MLANLDELILPELDTWKRVLIGVTILFAVWLLTAVVCAAFYWRTRKACVLRLSNGHKVYVQYGDVLDKRVICGKGGAPSAASRNVVIPVNCCFDTIVDDDLVSLTKLHGKALDSLYQSGQFTAYNLNQAIQSSLVLRSIPFKTITTAEKHKGNLERYPFGTVAEITVSNEEKFFLLALTEFDSDLHARIYSRENYMLALQRLLEYICSRSQGYPTVLPLIGGGLPEVSDSEQTVLELLLSVIKINKDRINCDIHIVVRATGTGDISIFS